MRAAEFVQSNIEKTVGQAMHSLVTRLYPICRSITGDGIRQTLRIVQEKIPLRLSEVATGTEVFDWTIPNEWNIRQAWIKNPHGETVVDFAHCNLHVVNYSSPIHQRLPLAQLRAHLHTIPEHPDWIPYRTSYYRQTWGFCLSQRQLDGLEDGDYEVYIDSTLQPGSLTYGEYYLPGASQDEILISTHCCHPSLCNDNLSGIALTTFLAQWIGQQARHYSYRFLFLPGTIGAITWLSQHEETVPSIKHGLVVACVGDAGELHYKRSRQGNAEVDRAVIQALNDSGQTYHLRDFSPFGYDERQYSSPAFKLPVGCLSRTPHGQFAEYHTSADDLSFVNADALADSLRIYQNICSLLEADRSLPRQSDNPKPYERSRSRQIGAATATDLEEMQAVYYRNLKPKCEPQLGKRGLYSALGGRKESKTSELAVLWLLNFSDGEHSLLHIAEKSGISLTTLNEVAQLLVAHNLLELL